MNKIICEFCGTSYSETAAQCPICGCVRPADDNEIIGGLDKTAPDHEYHYVKGGRFSEKNVKKRIATRKPALNDHDSEEPSDKEPSNKGLIITIFVLLLAIAAVIVYIALTFFGPDFTVEDLRDEVLPSAHTTEATEDLRCKEIQLQSYEVVLEEIGAEALLEPILTPINTNEQCTYYTNNDAVAIVNAYGVVTAIASGEATITVSCGNASTLCTVTVLEPSEPFALAYEDITLAQPGDSCLLYNGTVNIYDIIWASDDDTIAFVENGTVIAVGSGTTTVYASYNGETATCVVRCEFGEEVDETVEETMEPTQPIIDDNGPYQLKNAFGFSNSDVTIRIGESFTLILVDKDGNKVEGVSWSVINGNSCKVENGVVTGETTGKATVVATFNGQEYTCLVRVS